MTGGLPVLPFPFAATKRPCGRANCLAWRIVGWPRRFTAFVQQLKTTGYDLPPGGSLIEGGAPLAWLRKP